jgi:HSP20 family protein
MTRSSHWRREPFVPLNSIQNELLRLLEQYFQPEPRGPAATAPTDLDPAGWTPLIDVYETPEETLVVAEIPGVDPANVELSVTGNLLMLRGAKEDGGLTEAQPQTRERRFGGFHRQVVLSNDVDFDAAQADARHGVLTIRLPKRKSARPRNIPIRPS